MTVGGAGDASALRHHPQKLFTVEPMKDERFILTKFRWRFRLVVETVQHGLRVPSVPLEDLFRITVVEQINQDKFPVQVG